MSDTEVTRDAEAVPVPEPAEQKALPAPEEPEPAFLYCPQCGEKMAVDQRYCTSCGWDAEEPDKEPPLLRREPTPSPRELGPPSDKNRLTALLLCVLIGWLGAHRFYIDKPGTGLLYLLSLGILGVGVIYDAVMLATGELEDGAGKRILHWQ